ncbi:MAG: DUF115 domain-containing protein [archaeon]|nr:DUF115 domain-containing protein [archaeon]
MAKDLADLDSPLGKNWYDKFYSSISTSLGYSKESDERSRNELSILLKRKGISTFSEGFDKLYRKFKKRNCLVFGTGPSLQNDIMNLYPIARKSKNLVIAADGATDRLIEAMIVPQITVSDLDSSSESSLISQSQDRTLFVHAHGDNFKLVSQLVPQMGKNILGTTQVSSLQNVRNIGGFMDGDRACYLASSFEPDILVIAGMDFTKRDSQILGSPQAKEGINSQFETNTGEKRKALKLEFGKRSLEFLIERKPQIRFLNSTSYGESIRGAEGIEITRLIEALS